ncbi:MobF family relaxase [Hoyosella altamirensis]|uniref:Conjugative relaxase-like TrwC/TraI family protein n=1 Tax=Hoyosella altamirensis TaxID=616997 RepID=A0A839RUD7_9ACTN|nr:MobF family relaxase [Hoyosella altamirensis]MBB3040190.1 conjugative relaxase-like TrwC/TraI family protein [Hoyosella altamirensis]
MTLHVLHAGDGYAYLTRQVASMDRARERGEALASYYTEHGTPPGVWLGSGLASLAASGPDPGAAAVSGLVSEAQMKALFGEGLHPNATEIAAAVITAASTPRQLRSAVKTAETATRLGRRFPVFANENPLRDAFTEAVKERERQQDRPATTVERAGLWRTVGAPLFEQSHGRAASSERELVAWIARQRGTDRQPVAGYDLVFTPAKSVSVLWALGNDHVRDAVTRAHHAAVRDAVGWLETEAAFTRRGAGGVQQIDTTGLIVAAFDHYDNRAGEPNLHTHCAVSNKVCGTDGKWSALDGAALHRHATAAAARYNAAVVDNLRRSLGIGFTVREMGAGKQPVLEVAGIDQGLCEAFATRTAAIRARRDDLVTEFRAKHGYSPDQRTLYRLAQQATLDTRDGKQQPQSLAAMRAQWRAAAAAYLGSEDAVDTMLEHTLTRRAGVDSARGFLGVEHEAALVLEYVAGRRATFTAAQVRTRTEAQLALVQFPTPQARRDAIDTVITRVLTPHNNEHTTTSGDHAVALTAPEAVPVPARLQRSDGESVLTRHGETRYTTLSVLRAEQTLMDATTTPTAHFTSYAQLRATAAAVKKETGRGLNGGQWEIARHFCLSGAQVAVATGPAGAGKTTAMKLVADTWKHSGRDVVALAPSAVAADTLGSEIGTPAATLASLTYPYRGRLDGIPAGTIPRQIQPGTMLLVDEAAMASLPDLAALQEIAQRTGAVIRLLGDPAQLDAIETGGTLRLLADHTRAPELDTVVRFGDDHAQAAASLQLRAGNPQGLALYAQRGWIHDGTRDDLLDQATTAYLTDRDKGRSSIVLAATRDDARALNQLLQTATHTTATPAAADASNSGSAAGDGGRVVGLCDGATARVGDTIVTRHNDTTLRVKAGSRPGERVRNGDLWTITTIGEDGSIGARNLASRGTVTLPAGYVTTHVELGYACTIHRAQGVTVDTTHALITGHTSRAGLYVAATRGRSENHLYVPTDTQLDIDTEPVHLTPSSSEGEPMTVLERLTTVLERDQGQRSATETLREVMREAEDPQRLRDAYTTARDALTRDYLDWLIDRSLPAALTETMRAHADTHAALYARLTALTHHGHDTTRLLTSAIHTRDLTTAHDVNTVLLQHLPHPAPDTPGAASTPQTPETPGTAGAETTTPETQLAATSLDLGVLPPRHPGMDHQLADYARTAHTELTHHAATPAPGQRARVDAVVAAELRGNPVRQLSDQLLRRIASGHDPQRGTDATIVMAGHSALTQAEHAYTRARDDLARLTQEHAAWQDYTRAAQHADSLNTQCRELTREIRRLETERARLGVFARARRRELDTTLAKLGATHTDLDNQARAAFQHAQALKPAGPPITSEQIAQAENLVTATAAQAATARASHTRRTEQIYREQHHRQAAAQQELHRRNKLTPEQHAQEQRLREDLTRQKHQTRPTPALDHAPTRSPGRSTDGHGIGD